MHVLRLTSCMLSLLSKCTATPDASTLSLHDALPICGDGREIAKPCLLFEAWRKRAARCPAPSSYNNEALATRPASDPRSEEHTSELQSPCNLVCRLLLEKKKTADTIK